MSVGRRAVLLGLGAALSGCAAPGSALYQVVDAFQALDKAKKQYPFSRADIDGQPLGVLGVQVEGGLKGIVVWNKYENGYDYWRSGNGVVIVTQAGRLIRTSGFPQDQLASRVGVGTEYLGLALDPARHYQVQRELDFLPDQYGVEAHYRMEYQRSTEIVLLDRRQRVEEWAETVRLPHSRQQWQQLVQVDGSSGVVLRTIQHVGPKLRVILEVLKAATPA